MSLFRSLRVNGCWVQTNQQDFWQISTTAQDPSIPNLPLESPAGGGQTYSYAGAIAAQAAISATWRAIWNPAELLAATSGISAGLTVIWNPAELAASAQGGLAAMWNATWKPPASVVTTQGGLTAAVAVAVRILGALAASSGLAAALRHTVALIGQIPGTGAGATTWRATWTPTAAAIAVIADLDGLSSIAKAWAGTVSAESGIEGLYGFAAGGAGGQIYTYAGLLAGHADISSPVDFIAPVRPVMGGGGGRLGPSARRRPRLYTFRGRMIVLRVALASAYRFQPAEPAIEAEAWLVGLEISDESLLELV